jgi:hypothetical protein
VTEMVLLDRRMLSDMPRQQLTDLVNRMIGNAAENLAEVSLWINSIYFCGYDKCKHDRGPATAFVRACEGPVFAAQGRRPHRAVGGIVAGLKPAVSRVANQCRQRDNA